MHGSNAKRIGLIRAPLPQQEPVQEKLALLGNNTGNMLFWHGIQKVLGADIVPYVSLKNLGWLTKHYDALVTTDYVWLCENTNQDVNIAFHEILDACDIPVIPMSIGLQTKGFDVNFKLHPQTVRMLAQLQERCVLGVRGYYTAYILNKHGIKNLQVIGCPAMYYPDTPAFQIANELPDHPLRAVCNFRFSPKEDGDFGDWLPASEKAFLRWCAKHGLDFIEQTLIPPEKVSGIRLLKSPVTQWYVEKAKIFFDIEEWKNHYQQNADFAIGSRFHGNVVALWNGTKALFLTVDSRTLEMTDFFNLPTISYSQFDESKPMEYYYELADYSLFNKNYKVNYQRYMDFLRANGLV